MENVRQVRVRDASVLNVIDLDEVIPTCKERFHVVIAVVVDLVE